MRGGGGSALLLALAMLGGAAQAASPSLEVGAEVTMGTAVEVAVTVHNPTGAEVSGVTPEIRYRLAERTGAPAPLAPGATRTWTEAFPLPDGPGGDVLVVVVRWTNAGGRRHSRPFARTVETPGLLPTEAQVLLASEPASGHERATVRIVNATGTAFHGRLVAILPDECFTTPVAQPIDVPPRQTLAVPISIQSDGVPGTTYPLYVGVQFTQGGIPRAIVADTTLGVGTTPDRSTVSPLAVGATLLALAVGATLLANRRAARTRRDAER